MIVAIRECTSELGCSPVGRPLRFADFCPGSSSVATTLLPRRGEFQLCSIDNMLPTSGHAVSDYSRCASAVAIRARLTEWRNIDQRIGEGVRGMDAPQGRCGKAGQSPHADAAQRCGDAHR